MTTLFRTTAYTVGVFSLFGAIGWGWRGAAFGAIGAICIVVGLIFTLGDD